MPKRDDRGVERERFPIEASPLLHLPLRAHRDCYVLLVCLLLLPVFF